MAVAVGDQRRKKEAMESLIADITKGSEQAVFPAIRGALERGWTFSFVDALSEAKAKKEAEIDRLCTRHYGGFLTSVQELLTMKGNAENLRELVTRTHNDFNSIGVVHCSEVSRMMVEAQDQLDADDHYGALLSIDKLQTEQHNITVRPFLSAIQLWLPASINRLLDASRKEVSQWASNSQEKNLLLGITLLRKYARLTTNIPLVAVESTHQSSNPSVAARNNKNNEDSQRLNALTKDFQGGISISLLYILRNGRVFRLQNWMQKGDVDGIIPTFYTEPPTEEEHAYCHRCQNNWMRCIKHFIFSRL